MGKKILHNGQNIQTKSILPIQIPVYANYAYEKKEEKKFLVNTIKFCLPVYIKTSKCLYLLTSLC